MSTRRATAVAVLAVAAAAAASGCGTRNRTPSPGEIAYGPEAAVSQSNSAAAPASQYVWAQGQATQIQDGAMTRYAIEPWIPATEEMSVLPPGTVPAPESEGIFSRRYSDLSLTDRDGPVLVLYTEQMSDGEPGDERSTGGRTGNELVMWRTTPDGAVHSPSALSPQKWSTFRDATKFSEFTSAPYQWLGDCGLVVWDDPFRWWLSAELLGGEVEPLAGWVTMRPRPRSPWGERGQSGRVDPDLALGGGRVYLVAQHQRNEGLLVSSAAVHEPHQWTPFAGPPYRGTIAAEAQVRWPAIAATSSGAVFVSYTKAPAGAHDYSYYTPPCGLAMVVRTADGENWTDPLATVSAPTVQMTAVAVSDAHGLVLVYTAEHRDGWPVFAARSMDNGETWGRPVMLTDRTVYAWRPDAMLRDGVLYVAYLGMPTPPTREGGASNLADPEGAYILTVDPATLPVAGE